MLYSCSGHMKDGAVMGPLIRDSAAIYIISGLRRCCRASSFIYFADAAGELMAALMPRLAACQHRLAPSDFRLLSAIAIPPSR